MTDYAAVLTANYAGKQWTLAGDEYSGLTWLDSTPQPTQAELDAQWPTVAYNQQVAQVEANRRTQYEAQSDGIYFEWQRGTNTQAAWETAVQAVKDANPYPPNPVG
jgi:hypothetical protein